MSEIVIAGQVVKEVGTNLAVIEEGKGLAERVAALGSWFLTPEGAITAGTVAALALVWFSADKIQWVRLRDHVLGKHVGR